jgi:hypothetical protein
MITTVEVSIVTGVLSRFSRKTVLMGVTEPVSDPKELDTGGPHSLVYEESTGKYVHRHDLESSR